jgi:hypothetical protein
MSLLGLNNPAIAAQLNPQFGSLGNTVTITPLEGTDMQSASIVMNTGNSLEQYYRLYVTRGNGEGLQDGHMQLFSYNVSSDAIAELVDITPQNSTSDALIDVTSNVVLNGATSVNNLVLNGVSSGANFNLTPASGSDLTIRLNGASGVGYPYDTRYNKPAAGRAPIEAVGTAWAGVGTYAFSTELTAAGSGNYLGDLCIVWDNGTAANAATDKISVAVMEVGSGSTQIDVIDIPVPTLAVAEASRVMHYPFYSVNAYDATKTHNLTIGKQGTPTIPNTSSISLTMQRLA